MKLLASVREIVLCAVFSIVLLLFRTATAVLMEPDLSHDTVNIAGGEEIRGLELVLAYVGINRSTSIVALKDITSD